MFSKVKAFATRPVAVAGTALALMTATAVSASAADVVTPVITTATTDLQPTLLAVGGLAIGVSAVVLALRKGWRFFAGMIH